MNKIAVLDYGVGNLKSIMNALAILPCDAQLTRDPEQILTCDKVILPGVGAFGHCMDRLCFYGLHQVIQSVVNEGKALLGICVGMQMLFESSEEHGFKKGLGLIEGAVKKLPVVIDQDCRLPHIGWNEVRYLHREKQAVFSSLPQQENYYFVHSYACQPTNDKTILAKTHYADIDFAAAVIRDNICGLQYHPERSGKAGLELLNTFVA